MNYVDETPVQQEIQHFEIARETRATSTDSIQSPIHQQSSDAEEGFFHTHSQSFSSNSSPISYRSPIERQRTETQSSPSIATDAQPNQDVAETPVHSLHRTTSHPKPFESRQEAELLRHFIDHVSCFVSPLLLSTFDCIRLLMQSSSMLAIQLTNSVMKS